MFTCLQNVGDGADVVLMAMGDEQAPDAVRGSCIEIADVGNDAESMPYMSSPGKAMPQSTTMISPPYS